ncbi:MAG: cupin domain-containing protein [Muribaculaceae bacterium]|nr:cupin domain-containing protein [Muribaculaceae bacterium]
MKTILLSGGSGKRLWPLSNDARSKQFLKLLRTPQGEKESMIQRVVRQISAAGISDGILVATGVSQKDSIENQLGGLTSVITEPSRRSTFPAIVLACSRLAAEGTGADETVAVMPCDTFADESYFESISRMDMAVRDGAAEMALMGVVPTYPSAKYGYILPGAECGVEGVCGVRRFVEKPEVDVARSMIEEGALWNGGVFVFRLGWFMDLAARLLPGVTLTPEALRERYATLPKISFDYAVVEKLPVGSLAVAPYEGEWKDLGTWNTLTDELRDDFHGNVIAENCEGTYIINELELPLVCLGAKDMVVAATPDGILVTDRRLSENLKRIAGGLDRRPMYEERRWGEYKVIDSVEFPDGFCALTKQLTLRPGCSISYQRHNCRAEIWTFIDGEGEIILDGERRPVRRGDVIHIPVGMMHALRARTPLTFIEVQQGANLVEEDIERFPLTW